MTEVASGDRGDVVGKLTHALTKWHTDQQTSTQNGNDHTSQGYMSTETSKYITITFHLIHTIVSIRIVLN